ncbi:FecCD family ABC transporter permease [Thermotalea metallivorans]|uniref:Putative siderophore transport system permease protein YfhA n=1 Tax=Thermotalea metallivorans TaxID=520762 RepID=A0A140L6I5_9FIRM|nr:iron ABC transporter permease [Thermotalea metallivorans]KXG76160.1 putative siderophore transport system permease protein YfhA [Thermotalea metallivorans]
MNQYIVFRNERWRVSFLINKKIAFTIGILMVLTGIVFIGGIGMGDFKISPIEVMKAFLGKGEQMNRLVIQSIRLPRLIISTLIGASLAVAGAILQGIIRNPLASPDVIGITGGASIAAVGFIVFLGGKVSIQYLPLAAMLGGGLVTLIIYFLSWNKGVTPIRLVLIGIGMAAMMKALTSLMIILSPSHTAHQAYIWLTGSVYGATWKNVFTLLPWSLIFIPTSFIYARNINIQELGDEIATGVGSNVQYQRFVLICISVVLAGSAVSIAGAVGFIGLIAPHIGRKFAGPSFGGLLPVSALIGSLLMILADIVGRTAFSPLDIPAGVFTSAIGAPFFIYLLYKNRNC